MSKRQGLITARRACGRSACSVAEGMKKMQRICRPCAGNFARNELIMLRFGGPGIAAAVMSNGMLLVGARHARGENAKDERGSFVGHA